MTVRLARPDDIQALAEMRNGLWPEDSSEVHRRALEVYFASGARDATIILVAVDSGDRLVGFVEMSIRPFAEGCTTEPVAYLEGWYVRPVDRGHGVGRAMIAAAESWAREQGLTEIASNAYAGNDLSAAAHQAVGFEEVALVRCYRKQL